MNANYGTAGAPAGAAYERRAFERLRVRLPAQLRLESSPATASLCEIRDFCVGGMFVVIQDPTIGLSTQASFPSFVRGAVVNLGCTIQTDVSARALQFRARIVRHVGTGLGLAFVNPDFSALQAFHQFAMQAYQTHDPYQNATTTHDIGVSTPHPEAKELLERCARSTIHHGARLIQEYLGIVGDKLARLAADKESFLKQNAYLEAVRTIEAEKSAIQQSYNQALADRLKNTNPDATVMARASRAVDGSSGLSLIEDDALDTWLAITETTHVIETTCKSVSFEIEQRLSLLYGTKIDTQNNPLGPVVFVLALEEALHRLPLEHDIVLSCYKVFKDVANNLAPQFYGALNQFLIDQQVLPDLSHQRIVRQPVPQHVNRNLQQPPAQEDAQVDQPGASFGMSSNGGISANYSAESSTPRAHVMPVQPDNVGFGSHDIGRTANTDNVIPPATSMAAVQRQSDHVFSQVKTSHGNLYQLIGSLQSLQRDLHAQRVAGHHSAVAFPDSYMPVNASSSPAPAGIEYNAGELVNAITALEQSGAALIHRSGQGPDLKSLAQAALKHQNDAASLKQLDAEVMQVIDIANSLFQSLSQDRMLPQESHTWLEKVELPLLKLALNDQSLFENRDHVARQFINRVAKLGLSFMGNATDFSSSLRGAVSKVINETVQNFDGSPRAFTKAMQELDELERAQQHIYSTNVRQLVQVCEKKAHASDFVQVKKSDIEVLDRKSRAWAKLAKQLKLGTSVLFNDREPVQALRLVWMSPERNNYVFVNLQGIKEQELSLSTFAKMLSEGTVSLMDETEEQPIDRAQFSILKELQSQFAHDAQVDALTGTYNRREFERRLRHALKRTHAKQVRHALYQFDIDKFRVINNTWGYGAGDGLLKGMALAMMQVLGDRGIIGRIASDEFMVLIEDIATPEDAAVIAKRLVSKAAEFRLLWEGVNINTTVSTGLVIVDSSSTDILDFMHAAQSACELAKKQGHNLIHTAELDDTALAHQRDVKDRVNRIDELLGEDRLALVCQKIEPLDPKAIHGAHYEVLLRIRAATGELRPPGNLIIAAEEYQRITQIDRWVVMRTLHWMTENRKRLDKIGGMAINLSGMSLSNAEFMDFVLEKLIAADIPMEKVCFEITETAGIGNLYDTADFILEMKETGCLFSLDDFGTGLSSYDYLKKLPVDFLKIDGSFVQDICNTTCDYAMVKSITEIGHFMGKRVIAEHAKDSATLEHLREIGVDYAQGFAIAKPVPLEHLFT